MALTLMILLVNRWAYQVFFVFESEWFWGVERTPLADSFAQDGLADFCCDAYPLRCRFASKTDVHALRDAEYLSNAFDQEHRLIPIAGVAA
jgi:hypothetical protein